MVGMEKNSSIRKKRGRRDPQSRNSVSFRSTSYFWTESSFCFVFAHLYLFC